MKFSSKTFSLAKFLRNIISLKKTIRCIVCPLSSNIKVSKKFFIIAKGRRKQSFKFVRERIKNKIQ
jgi:CxxC motif-containing protein